MKNIIFILLVVSTIISCTKKDVEPDPVEVVVGTYNLTSIAIKSSGDEVSFPRLPFTQSGITISGTAELTSRIEDEIDIKLSIKSNGIDDDPTDFEGFELKKNGSNYNLYLSNQKVADLDGENINFDFTTVSGGQTIYLRFSGKK